MKQISLSTTLFLLTVALCAPLSAGTTYEILGHELLKNYAFTEKKPKKANAKNLEQMPELSPYEQYRSALAILSEHESHTQLDTEPGKQSDQTMLHSAAASDLTLFFYDTTHPESSVLATLDRTRTKLGTIALGQTLLTPTTDTQLLMRRQKLIAFLRDNPDTRTALQAALSRFAHHEELLLSLWNEDDILYGKNTKESFYENCWEKWLGNGNDQRLEFKRLKADFLMVFMPTLIYGFSRAFSVLPLGIGNFINSWVEGLDRSQLEQEERDRLNKIDAEKNKAWANYTSLIITGLLTFVSWRRLWTKFKNRSALVTHIRKRFTALSRYMHTIKQIKRLITEHSELETLFTEQSGISAFLQSDDHLTQALIRNLRSRQMNNSSYFDPVGKVFQVLPQFREMRSAFAPSLITLGRLDMYCGLAQLLTEQGEDKRVCYSFPEYDTDNTTPYFELTQFWHPQVNPEYVVPSSLALGLSENSDTTAKDMLLTGPNAAGKSTVIKAVLLTILLGQTIGMTPARSARFTPFGNLTTYLHITDDIGAQKSLFKAEVCRAQELLNTVETAPDGHFVLTIMDEIFSGTAPREGEAAAYGVAHAMAQYPNSITLLATHFPKLTHLERDTNGTVKNYHVAVERTADGGFSYPFELYTGASNQAIALALLEKEGFDQTILTTAHQYLAEADQENATSPNG